jgi:hypothetical protein
VVGLVVGLVGCLLGMLIAMVAAWRLPLAATSAVSPYSVYRKDVRSQLMNGLLGGLLMGLLVGLWVGLDDGLGAGLSFGLAVGVLMGLLSGAAYGAASSLLFTEIALRLQGRRVRFMPVLETALERQVLRQAGAVYQFRHADLQDRLAGQYEAGMMGGQPPSHGLLVVAT